MQLRQTDRPNRSDSHQVARNVLVIGSLVVGAKLFAAVREVVIAWRYGVGSLVDSYQLAFTTVTWAPMLLTSIMITSLVPQLVLSVKAEDHGIFVSELNGAVALLAGVTLVSTIVLGPYIVGTIAEPLGATTVSMARQMVLYLSPVALFLIISGYLGTRLQASQRFSYTFFEAMPPLFLCILVLMAGTGALSYRPLVIGLLVGGIVQLGSLVLMVDRMGGGIGGIRLGIRSTRWRATYMALGMIALGQAVNAASIPVDQILATRLGTGAVSTIGYSNRLVGLVTSLCITVIGYSLLPVLSEIAARGELKNGQLKSLRFAGLLFIGGAIGAAVGWATASVAVRLAFERGAFSSADTQNVAHILSISLIQIPFFASGIALMQWLAAANRHGLICLALVLAASVKLGSALVLSQQFGLAGLAMSQVLMYLTFALGMLGFVLRVPAREPPKPVSLVAP